MVLFIYEMPSFSASHSGRCCLKLFYPSLREFSYKVTSSAKYALRMKNKVILDQLIFTIMW